MSEMVERVARAICAAEGKDPGVVEMRIWGQSRDFVPVPVWWHYRRRAEGALQAMREPTAKMLAAAATSAVHTDASTADKSFAGSVLELLPPTGHPDGRVIIAEIARDYRAMIDAALQNAAPSGDGVGGGEA